MIRLLRFHSLAAGSQRIFGQVLKEEQSKLLNFEKQFDKLAKFKVELETKHKLADWQMTESVLLSTNPVEDVLRLYCLHNKGFDEDLIAITLRHFKNAMRIGHLTRGYQSNPFFESLIADLKHGMQADIILRPSSLNQSLKIVEELEYLDLDLVNKAMNKTIANLLQKYGGSHQYPYDVVSPSAGKRGFSKQCKLSLKPQWKENFQLLRTKVLSKQQQSVQGIDLGDSQLSSLLEQVVQLKQQQSLQLEQLVRAVSKIRLDYHKLVMAQTPRLTMDPNYNIPMLQAEQDLLLLNLISLEEIRDPSLLLKPDRIQEIVRSIAGEAQFGFSKELPQLRMVYDADEVEPVLRVVRMASLPVREKKNRQFLPQFENNDPVDLDSKIPRYSRDKSRVYSQAFAILKPFLPQLQSLVPSFSNQERASYALLLCQISEGTKALNVQVSFSPGEKYLQLMDRLHFPYQQFNQQMVAHYSQSNSAGLSQLSLAGLSAILNYYQKINKKATFLHPYIRERLQQGEFTLGHEYLRAQVIPNYKVQKPLVANPYGEALLSVPQRLKDGEKWIDGRLLSLASRIQYQTGIRVHVGKVEDQVVSTKLKLDTFAKLKVLVEAAKCQTQAQLDNKHVCISHLSKLISTSIDLQNQQSKPLQNALRVKFNSRLQRLSTRLQLLGVAQSSKLIEQLKFKIVGSEKGKRSQFTIRLHEFIFNLNDYHDLTVVQDPTWRKLYSYQDSPTTSIFQAFQSKKLYLDVVVNQVAGALGSPAYIQQKKHAAQIKQLCKFKLGLKSLQPQKLFGLLSKMSFNVGDGSGVKFERDWAGTYNEVQLRAITRDQLTHHFLQRNKVRENVRNMAQARKQFAEATYYQYKINKIGKAQYVERLSEFDKQSLEQLKSFKHNQTLDYGLVKLSNPARKFIDRTLDQTVLKQALLKYSLYSKQHDLDWLHSQNFKVDFLDVKADKAYRKILALQNYRNGKAYQPAQPGVIKFGKINNVPQQLKKILHEMGVDAAVLAEVNARELVLEVGSLVSDRFYQAFIKNDLPVFQQAPLDLKTAVQEGCGLSEKEYQSLMAMRFLMLSKPQIQALKNNKKGSKENIQFVQRVGGNQLLGKFMQKLMHQDSTGYLPQKYKQAKDKGAAVLAGQLLGQHKTSMQQLKPSQLQRVAGLIINQGYYINCGTRTYLSQLVFRLVTSPELRPLTKVLLKGVAKEANLQYLCDTEDILSYCKTQQ